MDNATADQLKEAIRAELISSYGKGSEMYWTILGIVREAEERLKERQIKPLIDR